MIHRNRFIAVSFVCIFEMFLIASACSQYILVVGTNEANEIDLFHVNGEGRIEVPQYASFDNHYEAARVTFSPTGKYAFFQGWAALGGNVYAIDDQFGFQILQSLGDLCAGAVFSPDEKYFLTSTDFLNQPKQGTLALFEWNGSHFDLATTESVPTTATMNYPGVWSKRDEIFFSSMQGYLGSRSGGSLYQFHREIKSLELKQYYSPLTSGIDYVDLNKDENLIVFAGRQSTPDGFKRPTIGAIARGSDGVWQQKCAYRDPVWSLTYMALGIKLTPYLPSYVAVLIGGNEEKYGAGLWLYYINPNTYQISSVTYKPFMESSHFAMSPDGKFFAVSHEFNKQITIIELDAATGQFHERDRIQGPQIGCMAFLPQAFPPASADDACGLYDGTRSGKDSEGAAKPPVARRVAKRSSSDAETEWRAVGIPGKK